MNTPFRIIDSTKNKLKKHIDYCEYMFEICNRKSNKLKPLNQNKMTVEMNEFLEKLDTLCWEYHIEIKPTHPIPNDEYPTISIINGNEVVKLLYIDGDGDGK